MILPREFEKLDEWDALRKLYGDVGVDIESLIEAVKATEAYEADPLNPFLQNVPMNAILTLLTKIGHDARDPKGQELALDCVMSALQFVKEYRRAREKTRFAKLN